MYNIINKIENVKSFLVINDITLIVSKDNNRLFFNDIFIDEYIDSYSYTYLKELVYVKELDSIIGKSKIDGFSYLRKSDNRINYSIIVMGDFDFLNDDIIATFKILNTLNLQVIDIDRLKNIIHSLNLENFLFLGSSNTIHAYTLPTATPLWQFDLRSFGEYKPIYSSEDERKPYQVAKFLGVWQNQLLVACDGGLILCLSTESGDVLRKWDTLPNSAEEGLKDVFRGYLHQSGNVFQLNNAGNKIIGLYYCHWVEICLETGSINTKYLKETFENHQILSFQKKSGYAEDETHLYTTVELDQEKLGLNYMPTAICALNKETTQIDWYYRFDMDTSGDYVSVQIPQVSNGKLYQLTQNNVLYIFDKE